MADDAEQRFLAAIAANTNDAEARSVYADWLDERGDPRGEFLRLEAQLFAGPARFLELTQTIDPSWLASVTRRCDVVLVEAGSNKIAVIKMVREVTGLGLKEAKDLVDGPLPQRVVFDQGFYQAREIAMKFQATGGQVVVMPYVGASLLIPVGPSGPPPRYPNQQLWITRVDAARRIDAIRAVREVTGFALKEAKELIDAVVQGERRAVTVEDSSPERIATIIAVLRAACEVEGP